MKFLLLNQTFYPDVVSTAQHLSDLAIALVAQGHEVTVVSSRRAYDNPAWVFPAAETWRGVKISRIQTTSFGKAAKWRRAVDFASFIVTCCARLVFLRKPDVVVALTSPPLISFIGALYARLRGARFVYWVMDLNPDEAVAAGYLQETSVAARFLQALSKFSLRQAKVIVALDAFMKKRLVDKGITPDKIVVIPPWAQEETARFNPEGRAKFREAHGLTDKFVVMYSGNHSPCHPLDTLLDAARQMAADRKVVFLFVGGGSEFARVQKIATGENLQNVVCLPYQPLKDLAASLSAADLHTVVMGAPFVGLIHPCKIYNILAVGAPVLCIGPTPSHLTKIVADLDCKTSVSISHGDVAGCVAVIEQIRRDKTRGASERYSEVLAQFTQREWLPRLVTELERVGEARGGLHPCN